MGRKTQKSLKISFSDKERLPARTHHTFCTHLLSHIIHNRSKAKLMWHLSQPVIAERGINHLPVKLNAIYAKMSNANGPKLVKGEVRRKMNFTLCVKLCRVEGRGKNVSGQFFFVCEKDDREESSTKSLGGMTRPKDEMGSQIVSSESDRSHPILVYLSRNNNSQAQARRFPALTAPEPEFPVIFGSK